MSVRIAPVHLRRFSRVQFRFCHFPRLRSRAARVSNRRTSPMTTASRCCRAADTGGRSPEVYTFRAGLEAGARRQDRRFGKRKNRRIALRLRMTRRAQPRRAGYFNAVQVYPFSAGRSIRSMPLRDKSPISRARTGRTAHGPGPVAAGDTVRWVIGDTESGAGDARRVHILVKPTRPGIDTNLVLDTDRRTYLRTALARKRYMPSIAWTYPSGPCRAGAKCPLTPVLLPDPAHRQLRYRIEGDDPPGGRSSPYDDGRKVYIEFPGGSPRAKCLRSSFSDPAASPNSSTIAPTAMCADRRSSVRRRRTSSGSDPSKSQDSAHRRRPS